LQARTLRAWVSPPVAVFCRRGDNLHHFNHLPLQQKPQFLQPSGAAPLG
jgi:hypothetical protein